MPYPFVLATNGEIIARVNHDGMWSVRWDRVLDTAYQPRHGRRVAVIAYAKLLLAARDNFNLTPWDVDGGEWKHFQAEIDYIDHDSPVGHWQSTISYNGCLITRVNYDGSWSVLWNNIEDISRWPLTDYRSVALVALCRLFMAAKDRFVTSPWEVQTDEDDC